MPAKSEGPTLRHTAPAGPRRRALSLLLALLGCLLAGSAAAEEAKGGALARARDGQAAAREQRHVFLLAGQSNMAGRGNVEPRDARAIPNVLSLDAEGRWVPARDPIHWDKPSAGVGLARSFATEYLRRNSGVTVGLVPAACGGSPISAWAPGEYFDQTRSHPYDDALKRARLAMQTGTLRGILWHQGESDATAERARRYQPALEELIERFRRDLGLPNLPFVIGQLGQFGVAWNTATRAVDAAQRRVAAEVPFTAFVSSRALKSKSDGIHFDARSLREFGRRYAAAFASVEAAQAAPASPAARREQTAARK